MDKTIYDSYPPSEVDLMEKDDFDLNSDRATPLPGKRKSGMAYRRRMRILKYKRIRNIVEDIPFWRHACWIKDFDEDDESDRRYVKYQNFKHKGFHKRKSNRVIRRAAVLPKRGMAYRKLYDYWWQVI